MTLGSFTPPPPPYLIFANFLLCRTILQRGSAVEFHANVLAPEETEEQLDFQGLRYPKSKQKNTFV